PDRFRAPVVLCDLQGRSHEQAARHLGWAIGTVKSRHFRGRDRLRRQLERRGVAPDAGLLAMCFASSGLNVNIPACLVDATTRAAAQLVSIPTFLRGSAAALAQGVLRSMSATRSLRLASIVLLVGATVTGAGWLAGKSLAPGIARAQEVIHAP